MNIDGAQPLHRQVEIEIGGRKIKVDAGVAPLVAALNELPEIYTLGSCECDEELVGTAWVAFEEKPDCSRESLAGLIERLRKHLKHLPARLVRQPLCFSERVQLSTSTREVVRQRYLTCPTAFIKEIAASIVKFTQLDGGK